MTIETNKVVYPQGPIFNAGLALTDTTETLLYTAGTDGARIDAIGITTNDTADNTVIFNFYDDTSPTPVLRYKRVVPIDDGTGISTTYTGQKPECDALQNFLKCAAIDGAGVRHLYLKAGWSIKVQVGTALSSKTVYVWCQGWEF